MQRIHTSVRPQHCLLVPISGCGCSLSSSAEQMRQLCGLRERCRGSRPQQAESAFCSVLTRANLYAHDLRRISREHCLLVMASQWAMATSALQWQALASSSTPDQVSLLLPLFSAFHFNFLRWSPCCFSRCTRLVCLWFCSRRSFLLSP